MRRADEEQLVRNALQTQRVSNTMNTGVDIDGRRLFIVGEVNDELAYKVVTGLHVLDQSKGTIYLTLISPGGAESEGYAIYDAIRLAKNKVVIEGYGSVQSIAAAILQAGDVRRLAPECRFMVHNGSVGLHGDIDVDRMAALGREIQVHTARYHRILSERSGVALQTIEKMCKDETFFDAEQAVANGFADEVIQYE